MAFDSINDLLEEYYSFLDKNEGLSSNTIKVGKSDICSFINSLSINNI